MPTPNPANATARNIGPNDAKTPPAIGPASTPTPSPENDSGGEIPALNAHRNTSRRRRPPAMVRHTVRTSANGTRELRYGRELAIRLFCTQCLGWESDPADCTAPLCPLYPFRGLTRKSR